MQQLTDRQRAILDHEALTWRWPGAKDASILERFGVTPTRYYAELHAVLAMPAAVAYAPGTVRRLQRLAEARQATRTRRVS
jgi:hypothetical protein